MKYAKIGALMVGIMMTLSSCHSSKIASTLDGPNPEQARYESVVRNRFDYEAVQSKSKYTMNGMSLGGKMCLESGKRLCLQVNAPLLGFEVARVEATQDSVIIVDKYDKMYSVVRLSDLYDLEEMNGHEMEALECIMLGRIYIPGRGPATSRDYSHLKWNTPKTANGQFGNSVGTYQGRNYTLDYTIDASGRLVSTLLSMGGRTLQIDYAEYVETEKNKWVPTQETLTATDSDKKQLSAGLSLASPQVGESTWRDFEPTSSYRKVEVQDLVKTVKALM